MHRYKSRLAAIALALVSGLGIAQDYPNKTVKIVVALEPGGTVDATARLLAQRLGEVLKQPMVIENRPGGGGVLGADHVAKSAPDGYTLLISEASSIAPGPLMRANAPYDPLQDFSHIALLYTFPSYLTVRADYSAKSLQEFLALAKAKPDSINYSSAGIGSAGFLVGELLKQSATVRMAHVPYKGIAPAMSALMGGHIDAVFSSYAASADLVRAGKLRMLAATSEKRVKGFPDVTTIKEIVPGVSGYGWAGISGPAKIPPTVTRRIQNEVLKIMRSDDIETRLTNIGMEALPMESEEFNAFVGNEMRKWGPLIKASKIMAQ